MQVKVAKLTNKSLSDLACSYTQGRSVSPPLSKIYRSEHSPARTQIFLIELLEIPNATSVHLVRHNLGISHFVKTSGGTVRDTETPVNHMMIANAQALMNMMHVRLCYRAREATRLVCEQIVVEVSKVDEDLADYLVPTCIYKNECTEPQSCGRMGNSRK